MASRFKILVFVFIAAVMFSSCGEDKVTTPVVNETVLFENTGLVDSAVVYGCYEYTVRHFVQDTLSFAGFSKVKIMVDAFTNSDGSRLIIFYHTHNSSNNKVYEVQDEQLVNGVHTFEFEKPAEDCWFEVRLYISPPVCGPGEFKYIRARDLKIYGIN